MTIQFYKYQGTGNDFILVDNRQDDIRLTTDQIEKLCDRRFGIGADGLMELKTDPAYDFRMVYYNADGKEGSMCGNGGRCITRFAHDCGIDKSKYEFIAVDGPHESLIDPDGIVRLKMKDVDEVKIYNSYTFLNTGSPHVIRMTQDIMGLDVKEEGKSIRNNQYYKTEGVNVNFVEVLDEDALYVRTYERGVEDETFSCGTGVTAAALVNAHNESGFNHVDIKTKGGKLFVEFEKKGGENTFTNIWLCGPAKKVFEGSLEID